MTDTVSRSSSSYSTTTQEENNQQMNTSNSVDLKMGRHLQDYIIFECAYLKILPSGQFYPGENPRLLNNPPLALVLRIVTNEICIVLIEKKKEISIPLEQLCRFVINKKRDIKLEMKKEFSKFFYEYPLGDLDSRIEIAIDPSKGFFDKTTTIVFSPCNYIEDERFLKLGNEMRRLRFNKEISKKQISQLNQSKEQSDQSFSQELCEQDITDDHGKLFEKDKFVVTAQNIVKEFNVNKRGLVESVQSLNESIAEWINKTNTENIMDLPMTPPTIKPREEVTTQLEKQVNNLRITPVANEVLNNYSLLDMDNRDIMNLAHNKSESENSISFPKPINQNEALADKRHESEVTELYITFVFLTRSYVAVIPYETPLKDLINTIEKRYNVKVDHNNLYFKNAVNDRISIMNEEDWFVARFEAKKAMNNKLFLYFSQSY